MTSPGSESPRAAFAAGRVIVLIAIAGLILLFLGKPIARYSSAHYSFADFIQSFSPVNVDPGHVPANRMMGDPAVIYVPWLIFSRQQLREGRFPLWNPYDGGGTPHFANYQSGVLSPYNFSFYVLSLKAALLVSAFLKLFAIALFTYLFLKRCGLERIAALLGSTGFTFAGYHVVWLSGAITATAASLPAALFFSEVILQRAEATRAEASSARLTLPLAGLCLSLVVGLVAGHPENLYFGGLLLTAYLGFRLWTLRPVLRTSALVSLAGHVAACAAVAVLIAAVQLLPFLEYLLNSHVITGRSGLSAGEVSRPIHFLPLLLTPRLLGDATSGYRALSGAPIAFPEAIAPYCGATILLLAALSLSLLRTTARVRFFVAAMGLWLVYAFNPLGLAVAFRVIPGIPDVPVVRSHDIWLFAVCCTAAWTLDSLIKRSKGAPPTTLVLGTGLGVLAAGLVGAHWVVRLYAAQIAGSGAAAMDILTGELAFFTWTFTLGLAAILWVRLAERRTLRCFAAGLVVAVVFLQTGFLLRDFNPTIKDRLFYPETPDMAKLQRIVGHATLLVAGGRSRSLVADSNLVYGLALPNNYDGIWIRRYDRLYRRHFGDGSFPRTPLRFDEQGLTLFGIDYVLARGPLVNTELADRRGLSLEPKRLTALGSGLAVQSFTAREDDLQAIAVLAACHGPENASFINLRLEDDVDRTVVAQRAYPCSGSASRHWLTLSFPAIPSSSGKRYRMIIHTSGGSPDDSIQLYGWRGFEHPVGELRIAGVRRTETLAFDFAYHLDAFEHLATLKDRRLYRYLGGRSRYYTVGKALVAGNDKEAMRMVEASDRDPAETVVLSNPPQQRPGASANGADGRVEVLDEDPTRIRLAVTRSDPGYLVLARPYYPGWKASVDGMPRSLLRANYAFMAVEVPAGTSRVTIRYQPASVWWGAVLSLTGLLIGCLWIAWTAWRKARPAQSQ